VADALRRSSSRRFVARLVEIVAGTHRPGVPDLHGAAPGPPAVVFRESSRGTREHRRRAGGAARGAPRVGSGPHLETPHHHRPRPMAQAAQETRENHPTVVPPSAVCSPTQQGRPQLLNSATGQGANRFRARGKPGDAEEYSPLEFRREAPALSDRHAAWLLRPPREEIREEFSGPSRRLAREPGVGRGQDPRPHGRDGLSARSLGGNSSGATTSITTTPIAPTAKRNPYWRRGGSARANGGQTPRIPL